MINSKIAAAFFLFLLWTSPSNANASHKYTTELSPEHGTVDFLAIGRPSAIKIRGKTTGAKGSVTFHCADASACTGSGTLKLELAGLQTGIESRDRHMRDKYLEVAKYPDAQLVVRDATVPASFFASDGVFETEVKSNLTLHGVTQPLLVKTTLKNSSGKIEGHSEFTFKISDFGIEIPKFAGITVSEEVSVNVDFKTQRN